MAKTITEYLKVQKVWKSSILKLQSLALSVGLDEAIKWGAPTYSINKKNIIGLAAFKQYTCIWFFHGTFLKDEGKKLVTPQSTTKAMRQWRFDSLEAIEKEADLIISYIEEAIENEKQGKRLKPQKNTAPIQIPVELQQRLSKNNSLTQHFNKLTPSNQREYCSYIADAKRESTKQNRLEKIIPLILESKGLHDKYKK